MLSGCLCLRRRVLSGVRGCGACTGRRPIRAVLLGNGVVPAIARRVVGHSVDAPVARRIHLAGSGGFDAARPWTEAQSHAHCYRGSEAYIHTHTHGHACKRMHEHVFCANAFVCARAFVCVCIQSALPRLCRSPAARGTPRWARSSHGLSCSVCSLTRRSGRRPHPNPGRQS